MQVKSSAYVIHRRLREILKHAVLMPLTKGIIAGFPPTGKQSKKSFWQSKTLKHQVNHIKGKLQGGMQTLRHVPGCNDDTPEFKAEQDGLAQANEVERYYVLGFEAGLSKGGTQTVESEMLLQQEKKRSAARVRELEKKVKNFPEKKVWSKWFSNTWAFSQWLIERYLSHSDDRQRDQPLPPNDPWYEGKKLPYAEIRKKARGKLHEAVTPPSAFAYSVLEAANRSKQFVAMFRDQFGSLVDDFDKVKGDWTPLNMQVDWKHVNSSDK